MPRILHLEDDPQDAELIRSQLDRIDDVEVTLVRDRDGLEAALRGARFDLALIDYGTPACTGEAALELLGSAQPDLPAIVVSGTVGEELAVDLIKLGYTDYVLKDRLARLAPAVQRAIESVRERAARRASERALWKSEARLSFLLDRLPVVIWTLDAELRIRSVIGGGLDRFPFYPTDVEGIAVHDLPAPVVAGMLEHLRRALSGTMVKFETAHRNRWYVSYAVPLQDDPDEALIAFTVDITDRKLLERQLVASQRMDAIGQLAGGLAHDFNNLMTIVSYQGELLEREQQLSEAGRERAETVVQTAHRAAELTRHLLLLGREEALSTEPVSLAETVRGCERLLRSAVGERCRIELALEDVARVEADKGTLEQLLVNLVTNARDATEANGEILIEVGEATLTSGGGRWRWSLTPGRYVKLAVADVGRGMDEATLERLFEPFFTTKEPGRGTGLGLATVYSVVRQLSGQLWVDSYPGVGSVFKVYLPMNGPVPAPAAQDEDAGVFRGLTALVVDPDRDARELARAVLERGGARVLEASHEDGALLAAKHEPGPVDLLVCDAVLGELSGPDLLARLSDGSGPPIGALFTSSLPGRILRARGILGEHDALVEKPFSPSSLRAVLVLAVRRGVPGSTSEPPGDPRP